MKLSRRKFLGLIGISTAGVLVPKAYFTKIKPKAIEVEPKDADCLMSYSYVDEALLKVCPFPDDYRKSECRQHAEGLRYVARSKQREVSCFKEKRIGLLRVKDFEGKYYWVDATLIIAHLKPKAA